MRMSPSRSPSLSRSPFNIPVSEEAPVLTPRLFSLFVAIGIGCTTATPLAGQPGFLRKARERIGQVTDVVQGTRSIACGLRRVCGTVQVAEHFSPESYESLAVTTFDGTASFDTDGALGLIRDEFEGMLVGGGFLLAANSNPAAVQNLVARGEANWSQQELAQLRQFITGVDAVIVVHIRQVDVGRCELPNGSMGRQATVHLAVRWLNVDAGEIPWVATHQATACSAAVTSALTEALQAAAAQLSGTLPRRSAAR